MPELVEMPKLGMTMEVGTIVKWYKKEDDFINEGEPLIEVITDKVVMDVESPATGIVYKIFAKEGEEIEVGKVIAVIKLTTDSKEELAKFNTAKERKKELGTEVEKEVTKKTKKKNIGTTEVPTTPFARYIASKERIDLEKAPRNTHGIVTGESINKIKIASDKEEIPFLPMQKVMAKRMTESVKIPQFTLYYDIGADNLINLNNQFKKENLKSSISPILIKILAQVMDSFPIFCSNFDGEKIIRSTHKNIGIAVQTKKGLIVPVIKDVDSLSTKKLFTKFNVLTQNAKDGKLTLSDMDEGTITISNLGMFGVSYFKALLVPGQTAIIAISAIQEKLVIINSGIFIRKMMNIAISCDHRVVDGVTAAQFMQSLKETIEAKISEVSK
jgi:pyruvate dehydrogenase E2 component (dihydrolipoamide acetyltransferase)